MENKDLALRDTLLFLAIGVASWAFVALESCWWVGLIGIVVSALLVVVRFKLKVSNSLSAEIDREK